MKGNLKLNIVSYTKELLTYMLDDVAEGSKRIEVDMVYRDSRYGQPISYKEICNNFKVGNVSELISNYLTSSTRN